MSVRTFPVLALLSLAACDGGLDAYGDHRVDNDAADAGWWWMWPPSSVTHDDLDATEEPAPEPAEPGDPLWFDAHCGDDGCVVPAGFDPRDHLQLASDLCATETDLEAGPYFERLWFEIDRTWADEVHFDQADWTYRFSAPDPDDLWGYRWIRCDVDVTGGEVRVSTGFASDSLRSMTVEAVQQGLVHGLDHALDDIGGWNHVTRGGFEWKVYRDAPDIFLADDENNDWDSWNATTGERHW